jgi:heme/copper-type cytochrome/quinol oxidase subunit 2
MAMKQWLYKIFALLLVGWATAALLTSVWMCCHGIWFELFPPRRSLNPSQALYEMTIPPWWITIPLVVVVEIVMVFRLFRLRARFRTKRGQCPACGYQIAPGTGTVCSECGEAVRIVKT